MSVSAIVVDLNTLTDSSAVLQVPAYSGIESNDRVNILPKWGAAYISNAKNLSDFSFYQIPN